MKDERDWAFRKVKISDSQKYVVEYGVRHGGVIPLSGVGVDFGGWSALYIILTGLIRKGVMVREERCYRLVEGEPLKIEEPKLDKPYIKVRRQLIELFDGERVCPCNTNIWLDPRGDGAFVIIMNDMMKEFKTGQSWMEERAQHLLVKGDTLPSVIERAEALSKEFAAFLLNPAEDVILVEFKCEIPNPARSTRYSDTGVTMRYNVLVRIGDNLYVRTPEGGLKTFDNIHRATNSEGSRIIKHTPEREAALAALKDNLETLAGRLLQMVLAPDFAEIIDQKGYNLIEWKDK